MNRIKMTQFTCGKLNNIWNTLMQLSNNRILVKWLLNALYNNKYVPVRKKCKAYTYGNSNTLLGIYQMKPSLIKMLEYQILYTIFFIIKFHLVLTRMHLSCRFTMAHFT